MRSQKTSAGHSSCSGHAPSAPASAGEAVDHARRWFIGECGVGMGALALASLLGERSSLAAAAKSAAAVKAGPMAPKAPPMKPRAKRVIYLFMGGAPSQFETFDHKPELGRFDGKKPPASLLVGYRAAFINPNSNLLGPRYKFARHGKCGATVSELLPHTARIVDRLTFIKSMKTDSFNHAPAQTMMSTGTPQFGRPSLGAWTLYGLGSENQNLPGFVVLQSGDKGPSAGIANSGTGFLPAVYQGVPFRSGSEPVLYLGAPPGIDPKTQRDSLDVLRTLNMRRAETVGDPEISARVEAFELAYRMQSDAPEAVDISRESKETLELYGAVPGKPSFAANCLLARRLIERGVRFVQLFHEAWDHHLDLTKRVKEQCEATDRATAALIMDLERRGLLEDTLVIWGGEFGRTPMVQGGSDGRDHHPNAFTMWLAGGGTKPGVTVGETDDLGFNVVSDPVHVHDLHATVLHLLGFDHKKLTYRFQGRDFRLTDVAGQVVTKLLA